YPLETVAAMKRVVLYTQEHATVRSLKDVVTMKNHQQDAISAAAVTLAEQLHVDAIVCETKSGATATNIATHRPNMPIISVTSEPRAAQQLSLSYANKSFVRPDGETAGYSLVKQLYADGFFETEGPVTVAIVSGKQPGLIGATDTIRVRVLE
ncbi:MAG: pyruvate kinase alpha/beta domain-containing protein, partial [Candidatus Saccharimonadales bacterium]